MRIAIAGFYHDTNAFGSVPVTRANTSFYPLGNPEWNA